MDNKMKKLSLTMTSTPEGVKTGVPKVLHRGTYRYRSVESLVQNTFSTESPIMVCERYSDDDSDNCFSDTRPSKIDSKKHKCNVTGRIEILIVQILLGLMLGCIIGYIIPSHILGISPIVSKEFSLGHLRSKYRSIQPESVFDELEVAVRMINVHESSLSFVFAHHGSAEARNTALEVSTVVATLAAIYLGNGTVFTISREILDTNAQADYGQLLTQWRPTIEERRVMYVPNLNAFPMHLAPVFHTLCDEFTPYVRPSLCLHTVDVGNTQQPQGDTQVIHRNRKGYFTAVEQSLRQSWTRLSDEEFDPLLARIAGGSVFMVE